MTSSFDELYESLLTELSPVDIVGGYGGTGEETEAEFPEKSAGKYELTPEQTKEVAKTVVANLKAEGGHSDKPYKQFQEEDIAPVIKDVVGINMSNAKYAARVIHTALKNAGIITDERDGKAVLIDRQPDEEALDNVADEAENVANSEAVSGEDEQETVDSEFEDQDTLEEPTEEESEGKTVKEETFSPHKEYFISPEDDIKAGTLNGDLKSIYDKLSGMTGETKTGEEISSRLRKAGVLQGKITRYLNDLISKGVLEPQGNESGGSEALEAGDENMRNVEKDTFDRELSHAYRDYVQSGGGPEHGVDFG